MLNIVSLTGIKTRRALYVSQNRSILLGAIFIIFSAVALSIALFHVPVHADTNTVAGTPPMYATDVTPNIGKTNTPPEQQQVVTINGGEFSSSVDSVKFGGIDGLILYVGDNYIWAQPPLSSSKGPVDITITKSGQSPLTIHDGFTYIESTISGVNFTVESGKKMMTITGTNMVNAVDSGEYLTAAFNNRSLVTLNQNELNFCTEGTGYDKAALDLIGLGGSSDNPTCYYLFNSNGEPLITPTSAKIHLNDNFDMTAQGTVSVNGSDTFTFNQNTAPVDVVAPSAVVENKELSGNPVIAKRPTFSGTAEPGSAVNVTVHSDPITCTTTADSSGNWTCTLPSNLEPGQHMVYIQVVAPGGAVTDLGPYSVRVSDEGAAVSAQTITDQTLLAPNTGFQRSAKTMNFRESTNVVIVSILSILAIIGFIVQRRKITSSIRK